MDSILEEEQKPDILIVDDIPDNIRFLSSFLMSQGYEIRKATTGQMAIGAIKALTPDLILLDINMPDMNGYEICDFLKTDPLTSSIPIIFLSAGNDVVDKVKAFDAGGADYITKPFQLEEVLARIQTQFTIRKLQKKLEKQNLQLQQALEDLKRAQANLVQQEKMATLKKVVAGVAHEVNNPLSFILGNADPAERYMENLLKLIQLYQEDYPETSPTIKQFLSEIDLEFIRSDLNNLFRSMKNGAERIQKVVLALKNFTYLDEANIKQVNICATIDNVLVILRHRLNSRNDRVAIDVKKEYEDIPLVDCYADQFAQVIFNILGNAIDAVETKISCSDYQFLTPQIFIQVESVGDNLARIKIKDNGIGIHQANQDRLFEPFSSTKSAGQGIGLGLVISRRIIEEMHGGSLTYRSSVGEGTEFTIQIPISCDRLYASAL